MSLAYPWRNCIRAVPSWRSGQARRAAAAAAGQRRLDAAERQRVAEHAGGAPPADISQPLKPGPKVFACQDAQYLFSYKYFLYKHAQSRLSAPYQPHLGFTSAKQWGLVHISSLIQTRSHLPRGRRSQHIGMRCIMQTVEVRGVCGCMVMTLHLAQLAAQTVHHVIGVAGHQGAERAFIPAVAAERGHGCTSSRSHQLALVLCTGLRLGF